MATKFANVKGVQVERSSQSPQGALLLTVTYDLLATAYTGGTDTVQLGGGGQDNGTATSLTLVQLIQNHRRNGKTIALVAVAPGVDPGRQGAATNGPLLYPQSVAISSSNVTLNLFSAYSSGSAITTTSAGWDAAGSIQVLCTET